MSSSNVKGCALCCERFVKWFPVIFILAIVAWSYYAYFYSLCIVLFIIFYNLLLAIFLWSYFKAILAPPIPPPKEFYLSPSDLQAINQCESRTASNLVVQQIIQDRNLPVYLVGPDGDYRLCNMCKLIKPDRAHHCSTCRMCLLKMDHHCPWTNNCVGYHNHKFFIVFLAWGTVFCLYIACTSAPYFADFWKISNDLSVDRFQVLFLFLVSAMFGLCQMILGCYHIYLAGTNQTTLESMNPPRLIYSGPDKNAFNLGIRENLREEFGSNCCCAMLPVFTTPGDGVRWRFRSTTVGLDDLENASNAVLQPGPENH